MSNVSQRSFEPDPVRLKNFRGNTKEIPGRRVPVTCGQKCAAVTREYSQ